MNLIRPLAPVCLSPAQVRILAAVAAGMDNAEAARSIGRAEGTIKGTLTNIREALGALNTIHAVALMDDHCPGWRPRLALHARPLDIPARVRSLALRPESGPRRAGTA